MTFAEKLVLAVGIAQRYAHMDRYAEVSFIRWPHVKGQGFEEGEIAWEAHASFIPLTEPGLADTAPRPAKTIDGALDNLLTAMARFLRRQAEYSEKRYKDTMLEAANLRLTADQIDMAVGP